MVAPSPTPVSRLFFLLTSRQYSPSLSFFYQPPFFTHSVLPPPVLPRNLHPPLFTTVQELPDALSKSLVVAPGFQQSLRDIIACQPFAVHHAITISATTAHQPLRNNIITSEYTCEEQKGKMGI